MRKLRFLLYLVLLANGFQLTACRSENQPVSTSGKPTVLATTTIVGDVVSQVGVDLVELSVLLPPGADPHSFDPTPQDVVKLTQADVLFVNGAGLEKFLDLLIENADARDKVVDVSDGIELLPVDTGDHNDSGSHAHNEIDPHTWTSPLNVMVWVENIKAKLIDLDPSNSELYRSNAEKFVSELRELDDWIQQEVAEIPEVNRKIVTDHTFFGYFASEYGFIQIGTLIPGGSTLAEPSAQDLASVEDKLKAISVRAIFVGNTVNPTIAKRVAEDVGAQLVFIYTGSLGETGSGIETYLDYMRYNTLAFVNALK